MTTTKLLPHWKIRIGVRGGMIHLASKIEPIIRLRVDGVHCMEWEPINDPSYGDTLGFIDWSTVGVISWRFSEKEPK